MSININEINNLLPESMYYPCSEDDGTPIRRCETMFPLYIYVDYAFPKENILNRLRGYRVVDEQEFSPENFFGKTWNQLIQKYEENIKKLPFKFENPYILACEFVGEINDEKRILTVNIKFEGVSMFQEIYLERGIKPKGIAHIKCGIGFGGNYYNYVRDFNQKILNNNAGLPKYILADSLCMPGHGDYLPVVRRYKKLKAWEYYRPAYREFGFDILYELREEKKYGLIDILRMVNVVSEDNGEKFTKPRRRNEIIKILSENSKVELLYKDDYVLLYTTGIEDSGDVILISCHIDTVFDEEQLFLKISEDKVKGTLDNSATIASLIYSLQEYEYPKNVIISFTGGEEDGFSGAERTRDCLEDEFEDIYDRLGMVVVLDVSPDNTDKDVSVENLSVEEGDFEKTIIRFSSIEKLREFIEKTFENTDISFGIIEEAEPDESHFYAEWDLNTISLCLPCDCPNRDPHSTGGIITTITKMKKYSQSLNLVVNKILNLDA